MARELGADWSSGGAGRAVTSRVFATLSVFVLEMRSSDAVEERRRDGWRSNTR